MRRSLFRTLVLFTLLATSLLLGTIWYCYSMYRRGVQQSVHDMAAERLHEAVAYLDSMLSELTTSAAFVADQNELHHFSIEGPGGRLAIRDYVRSLLTSYANFQQPVVNVYFHTRDKSTIAALPEGTRAHETATLRAYYRLRSAHPLTTPFRDPVYTAPYPRAETSPLFALLMPVYAQVYSPRDTDYLGCLITLCDMAWLWVNYPLQAGYELLVTRGGEVYYGTDGLFTRAWQQDQALESLQTRGEAYRVLSGATDDEPFSVRLAYPVHAYGKELLQVKTVVTAISIGTVLAHAGLLLLLYHTIISPIRGIARQADAIADDLSRIENPDNAPVELAMLTGSLNSMLARVCELNENMLNINLQYLREHVLFLQSQINPHFLYNNLECMRGMAAADRGDMLREMIRCVANLYRYSSKAEHMATVREEFHCISLYQRIMHMRYDGKYTLELDGAPEALSCAIPRMTLQPLVENAIRHGFEAAGRDTGRVAIHAAIHGEMLHLIVSDDGRGMSEEQLARYNAPEACIGERARTNHIGITNVYSRIRLIFGGDSAMRFAHGERGGLVIRIIIYKKPLKF